MDAFQMASMAMQNSQEYASKMFSAELTEYEMLMYEQNCRFLEGFFKHQRLLYEKAIRKEEEESNGEDSSKLAG